MISFGASTADTSSAWEGMTLLGHLKMITL